MHENPDRAVALTERSLALAREQRNRAAEAAALYHLGEFVLRAGKHTESLAHLDGALVIYRDTGDRAGEARVLDALGLVYQRLQQPEKALEHLTQAVDLSERLGLRGAAGMSRANRASVLMTLGRPAAAEEDLGEAVAIAGLLRDDHLRGVAFLQLAVLKAEQGGGTDAWTLLENAAEAFAQAGDRINDEGILAAMESAVRTLLERPAESRSHEETSAALRRLARIHMERRQYQDAHAAYQRLLEEALRVGDQHGVLEAWIHLGHSSVLQAEHQRAAREHQEALEVLRRLREATGPGALQVEEREICLSLGQAQRHLGRPEEARASYERALTLATETGDREAKWRAIGNVGLIFADLGQFDLAIRNLESAVEFSGKDRNRRLEAQALFNLAAYALHLKGDTEKAWQKGEASRQLLERIGDPSAAEVARQMAEWRGEKEPGE